MQKGIQLTKYDSNGQEQWEVFNLAPSGFCFCMMTKVMLFLAFRIWIEPFGIAADNIDDSAAAEVGTTNTADSVDDEESDEEGQHEAATVRAA
ncbi:MAG: hypothetical protein FWG42_01295 [Clostridiales bacterium]|nr:hypothetical protein [Clostridiales bacterium]